MTDQPQSDTDVIDLLSTTDAVIWAKEFMRIWGARLNEISQDLMATWFANSMMTANDLRHKQLLDEKDKKIEELRKALWQTLVALVSYKQYIPEPYKQNPIYIMGSHEAEKEAVRLLSKHTAKNSSEKK